MVITGMVFVIAVVISIVRPGTSSTTEGTRTSLDIAIKVEDGKMSVHGKTNGEDDKSLSEGEVIGESKKKAMMVTELLHLRR